MSWISRLFQGSEVDRAREAAEASRERADGEARAFERWLAALRAQDRTTKVAANAHVQAAAAAAAAEKGDLPGWLEAREHFELACAAYRDGRAALAGAQPRESATLLLADAASATAGIRDVEDRSGRAADVAAVQVSCGDVAGARRTLATISEPGDRTGVERALVIARAATETLDPQELARELAGSDSDDWDHEEILVSIVEERVVRGDLAGARSMLAPVDDPELKARGWRCFALAEARQGRLAEARAIASRIEDPQWCAAAWSDIAQARAASGDLDGALETAEGIEDEDVRSRALGVLAGALVEAGRVAQARELVERIDDPQTRDDGLTWMVEAHAKKADFDAAVATIEELRNGAMQAQELVDLAEAARDAARPELARDLLRRALETAAAHAGQSPIRLARFLVNAHARLGEFEAAEAIVRVVDAERERAELLGSLSFHLTRARGGGLAPLEGLLDRHPGVLERIAILQHGAQGLLLRAQLQAAKSGPSSAPPPEPPGSP